MPLHCRTCLGHIEASVYFPVDRYISDSGLSIYEQLVACIPQLRLDVASNSIVCGKCLAMLVMLYKFQRKCLETEGELEKIAGWVPGIDWLHFCSIGLGSNQSIKPTSTEPVVVELPVTNSTTTEQIVSDPNYNYAAAPLTFKLVPLIRKQIVTKPSYSNAVASDPLELEELFDDDNQIKFSNPYDDPKMFNSFVNLELVPLSLLKTYTMRTNRPSTDLFQCGNCYNLFMSEKFHRGLNCEMLQVRCAACNEQFDSLQDYQYHLFRKQRFTCNVCDLHFANSGNLKRHMTNKHEGVKRYQCLICDKSYTNKNSLLYHVRSHTGERPFSCRICNRRFKLCKILKLHCWREHRVKETENMYYCDMCQQMFTSLQSLREHRYHTDTDFMNYQAAVKKQLDTALPVVQEVPSFSEDVHSCIYIKEEL